MIQDSVGDWFGWRYWYPIVFNSVPFIVVGIKNDRNAEGKRLAMYTASNLDRANCNLFFFSPLGDPIDPTDGTLTTASVISLGN